MSIEATKIGFKNKGNSGKLNDPYMAYNFFVEIDGLIAGGFSEVTGLSSEIEVESYAEGGVNNYIHKFPKHANYSNLVLIRGITNSDMLWSWYEAIATGKISPLNGTIMLRDDRQLTVMWWNFKQAYPVRWEGPALNANNATDIAVERIELVHQGISLGKSK